MRRARRERKQAQRRAGMLSAICRVTRTRHFRDLITGLVPDPNSYTLIPVTDDDSISYVLGILNGYAGGSAILTTIDEHGAAEFVVLTKLPTPVPSTANGAHTDHEEAADG